jgi:hypothetical protein
MGGSVANIDIPYTLPVTTADANVRHRTVHGWYQAAGNFLHQKPGEWRC